jgi:hypothetical protein
MAGLGDTKQEALEQLRNNFNGYLGHNIAPRPGTRVALHYAGTTDIDELDDIASDFFTQILNINYYNCFISDLSSLMDFGKNDPVTLDKINSVYKLNLTELGDGNIVRLLKMIKESKHK